MKPAVRLRRTAIATQAPAAPGRRWGNEPHEAVRDHERIHASRSRRGVSGLTYQSLP
jgi:hypothetical protein